MTSESVLFHDETEAIVVARAIGDLLRSEPVDLTLAGVGENAHLACNHPPANFATVEPYLVTLNKACHKQQVRQAMVELPGSLHAFAADLGFRRNHFTRS